LLAFGRFWRTASQRRELEIVPSLETKQEAITQGDALLQDTTEIKRAISCRKKQLKLHWQQLFETFVVTEKLIEHQRSRCLVFKL
jgi:hypothetical protein